MASLKPFRAIIALTTTTTTNLLNPPAASGGVNGGSSGQFILITQARILNRTNASANAALWLGATGANAAGTESMFAGQASAGALTQGVAIPANGSIPWYGEKRVDVADFLVGGASANSALTLEIEGLIGVA